jgi:CRISPR system Cascade subunit CasD
MIQVLLLRFDAPLMSFGGTAVDQHRETQDFPALSMLTGLLANALGLDHREDALLHSLQTRLRFAARRDRTGQRIVDFQTVDLGQPHLVGTGWTTRGVVEGRAGGSAGEGTHIRLREYHADAVFTVAVALDPGDPGLDTVEAALREPARPLFLGRKACLPATPILLGRLQATSLLDALRQAPPLRRPARLAAGDTPPLAACWPIEEGGTGTPVPVTDERDWANQVHVGRRVVLTGRLTLAEVADG